jgi:hypothetical protein
LSRKRKISLREVLKWSRREEISRMILYQFLSHSQEVHAFQEVPKLLEVVEEAMKVVEAITIEEAEVIETTMTSIMNDYTLG